MNSKMKLLIAYDGSECAKAALADLRRAGLPNEAEAVALSVSEHWLPPPSSYELLESDWRQAGLRDEGQALELAQQAANVLRVDFPIWEVRAASAAGSPAGKIIERADEWKPDLLVVGSHGYSALGRFFLGSVSQKVVTEAPCSVRVARRPTVERHAPLRLLIGTDGSANAQAAVRAVALRHWPAGSEARVVTSFAHLPSLSGRMPVHEHIALQVAEWNATEELRVTQIVESAAAQLKDAGLSVSTLVNEENPKKLLLNEAERWGADCIFVGATGLSRFDQFLLGSVATAVVLRATCAVEVVRAADVAEGT